MARPQPQVAACARTVPEPSRSASPNPAAAASPTAGYALWRGGIVGVVTRVQALLEALEVQVDVGRRLRSEQLPLASRCTGWTVRDVLEHSIGVTQKFTDFASGTTDEPHASPGDLRPDHQVALRAAADAARAAWGSVDLTRYCRLGFGTYRAELAAGINLFDVLAHTWDIAAAGAHVRLMAARVVPVRELLSVVARRAAAGLPGNDGPLTTRSGRAEAPFWDAFCEIEASAFLGCFISPGHPGR